MHSESRNFDTNPGGGAPDVNGRWSGNEPTTGPPGDTSALPAGAAAAFLPPSTPSAGSGPGANLDGTPYGATSPLHPATAPYQGYGATPGVGPAPGAPPPGGYGATSALPAGAVAPPHPASPPLLHRADPHRRPEVPSGPPVAAAPGPGAAPERVVPASGWGWRTLVAFVTGGALTAGGFAVARLGSDDGATTTTPLQTTTELAPAANQPVDASVEAATLVAGVLGPSVVQIETDSGTGSGVVYDQGLIITNHHVVDGAVEVTVLVSDGRALDGRVLGSNADFDVAVVAIDEAAGLSPATLATDEKPTVGQTAIAIGSPFSLQQSVTEGIVSAVDRPVPSGNSIIAMIQTDAPINPGNSGGALADRQGRVIGINTAIQTGGTSNTNAGIGFAIPIDTALDVATKLVVGEPIESGFLGVRGGPTDDGTSGVQVEEVTPGSAAETAGLLLGDHILSVDGAPVTAFEELAGLVLAHAPGDIVDIELIRDGQPMTISVTLGVRDG